MHLVSHSHDIVVEEGRVSGTLSGTMVVHLTLAYTEASITFTGRTSDGTLSGQGSGSYYIANKLAHFTGSLVITHGTGKYAHARATGLHITGTLTRSNYSFSAQLSGRMSY